jgi:threonine synthase
VSGFIAATNANDVVPEYLMTGVFEPRPSLHTLANAMDVGNPSNFERLLQVFGSDYQVMRAMVSGEAAGDDEILDALTRYYRSHELFLDPHTAAGVVAAERFTREDGESDAMVVTLATAHPAKFRESVRRATGETPELPPQLEEAMHKQKHAVPMAASLDALRTYLLDHYETDR